MTDFNELMKQPRQMQEQFQKAQQDLADLVVEGESGAGLVKISMNGRHDVVDEEPVDVANCSIGIDICCQQISVPRTGSAISADVDVVTVFGRFFSLTRRTRQTRLQKAWPDY